MASSGLVITPIVDASIVNFERASMLDAGSIDAVAADLYALVDQQARRKIILDFSHVKFLSSQMLGVLMSLQKKTAAIKGRLLLVGMRPDLMKVFTITRLDKVLEFADTEEVALRRLGMLK